MHAVKQTLHECMGWGLRSIALFMSRSALFRYFLSRPTRLFYLQLLSLHHRLDYLPTTGTTEACAAVKICFLVLVALIIAFNLRLSSAWCSLFIQYLFSINLFGADLSRWMPFISPCFDSIPAPRRDLSRRHHPGSRRPPRAWDYKISCFHKNPVCLTEIAEQFSIHSCFFIVVPRPLSFPDLSVVLVCVQVLSISLRGRSLDFFFILTNY